MIQHIFLGFHCLAVVAMLIIVVSQLRITAPAITLAQLGRLLQFDTLYSWSALIVVVSGFSLWILAPGLPGNSLSNPTFSTKLLLFIAVAGLSVYPSMVFLRLRDGDLKPRMPLPLRVRFVIALELGFLLLIIFLATEPFGAS